MWRALCRHWPEYLMEGWGLGFFMVSAGFCGVLLEHPASPVQHAVADPLVRRVLTGIAMGLTAIAIVYSPWGKQSGAHINPAVTVTFWRLGKIAGWDASFYVIFQFLGSAAGAALVAVIFGDSFTAAPVSAVATVPGPQGTLAAAAAEFVVAFVTMSTILIVTNVPRLARFTGLVVGMLIVLYITFESPVSGFSQNPARTFASAASANLWTDVWIYFVAPFAGMLVAAEAYRWARSDAAVECAKLHHQNQRRCIFCEYQHSASADHEELHQTSPIVQKEMV